MSDYKQAQAVEEFLKYLSRKEIQIHACADSLTPCGKDIRVAFAFMISMIDDFCYECSNNRSTPNIKKGSVIMRIVFPALIGTDTLTCCSVKLCGLCFTQCTLDRSLAGKNQSEACHMLMLVEQHIKREQSGGEISDEGRMNQLCDHINIIGSDDEQISAIRQQIRGSIGDMPQAFTTNDVPLGVIGDMLDGLDADLQRIALGLGDDDVLPGDWATGISMSCVQ